MNRTKSLRRLAIAFTLLISCMATTFAKVYNPDDCAKLLAFMEQTCADGIWANRKMLVSNPGVWDPHSPDWGKLRGVTWTDGGKLQTINWGNKKLAGTLDLSGCTALTKLDCSGNALTGINVDGCPALTTLNCSHNAIPLEQLPSFFPALKKYNYAAQTITAAKPMQGPMIDLSAIGGIANNTYVVYDGNDKKIDGADMKGITYPTLILPAGYSGTVKIAVYTKDFSDQNGDPEYIYAFTALPAPSYDKHDCDKLLAFLKKNSADSLPNWKHVVANPDTWDPEKPDWGKLPGVTWTDKGKIKTINWYLSSLAGALDLSGCTALDTLNCTMNALTALDVSNCTALDSLSCSYNAIPLNQLPLPSAVSGGYSYAPQMITVAKLMQGPTIDLSAIGHAANTSYEILNVKKEPIEGARVEGDATSPVLTLPAGYNESVYVIVHNSDFPDQVFYKDTVSPLHYSFIAQPAPPAPEYVNVYVTLSLDDPVLREQIGLNPVEGSTEVEKGQMFELRVWLNQNTDHSAIRVTVDGQVLKPVRIEQEPVAGSDGLRSATWTKQRIYVYDITPTTDTQISITGIRWNAGSNPTGIAPQPQGGTKVYTAPGRIMVSGATDTARVHIYNVNGQPVYSGAPRTEGCPAARGTYIVTVDGQSWKVVVK